jgi:hypothetical protein
MVLVATVAITLRLINPPTYTATTVLQLPPAQNGKSHPKYVIEQQLAFVRSGFIVNRALHDLTSSGLVLHENSRLHVREPDGWTDVTGHVSNHIEWLQSHLRVHLNEDAEGTEAELILSSSKGSSDALYILLRAVRRAYLDELDEAMKRRREQQLTRERPE